MRIISGENRGRKLAQIEGWDIRPTADRVREAIFNILGPTIRHARVLDIFAGTGALGLEALSRGAASAVFVESAPASCKAITENINRCKKEDKALLLKQDATRLPYPLPMDQKDKFDLVFMDPPYDKGLVEDILTQEAFFTLLAPGARVMVEQSTKEPPVKTPAGLDIYRQKKYSKTRVTIFNAV
ncbi:MAG: 16S rRNA (guanine(966)-N(2))-methyltransferase RsmD [Desulfobacterales bacterium]|nr:16S rRNA (guanine(966)-N(2))-methyltransferase RsmD [Desulfobacterales bacterium]